MLHTKFQVNWPFGSGEVKNRFSRWGHLGLPIGTNLVTLDLQGTLMLPIKSTGFSVQKKRKIDFQESGHLGFPFGTMSAFWIYKSP